MFLSFGGSLLETAVSIAIKLCASGLDHKRVLLHDV
jgi:hypothetical protein